jgi:secernin
MCDTIVATGSATADGTTILAKNSDREPNEAQVLTYIPRAKHEPGTAVKCTYIEVPQVGETCEVILSRPFWMWGAEMGANEHGVAIANEAVFTKEPYGKEPGLIGMDMLRLALERSNTARQALDTIVELLARYGQSGNCGFRHKTYYHNSFIVADPTTAWVLETAGQFWAAERVRDVRSISNGLTIGSQWDLAAPQLVEHAIEKGWCKSAADFHFARCYSDLFYTRLDGCRPRQCRSTELLEQHKGSITPQTAMGILQDHGPRAADPGWNPGQSLLMDTICVHAGMGPTRPSQSTGSLVAYLAPDLPTYWLAGTSGPCTSIFKPVFLGEAGLPDLGPEPAGTYDDQSLWWAHERLQRAVIRDYATRMPLYRAQRDALQAALCNETDELYARWRSASPAERLEPLRAQSASCFTRARDTEAHWAQVVSAAPVQHHPPLLFTMAWNGFDKEAGFPTR